MLYADRWTDNMTCLYNFLFGCAKITGPHVVLATVWLGLHNSHASWKLELLCPWRCGSSSYFHPHWIVSLSPRSHTLHIRTHSSVEKSRHGNFEKTNPAAHCGNWPEDHLTYRLYRTVSTELPWLPYEDFISIAYCTNDNSELIKFQQKQTRQFNFPACTDALTALVLIT